MTVGLRRIFTAADVLNSSTEFEYFVKMYLTFGSDVAEH